MFNIGMLELLVVLLIAFLIVGPKDLPKVARWVARQVKSLRKLVKSLKDELGWDELTRDFTDTKKEVEDTFREADVTGEFRKAADDVRQAAQELDQEVRQTAKDMEQTMKE